MRKLTLFYPALILLFTTCSNQKIETGITEDHILVRQTHVFLQLFDGFKRAETFRGVKTQRGDVTVKVQETLAPFEAVIKDFTPSKLLSKKMTFVSKEKLIHNGKPAIIYQLLQERYGTEYVKYNLVKMIDDSRTVIVRGSFENKESYQKKYNQVVYNTVMSAYFEDNEEVLEVYRKTYKLDVTNTGFMPVRIDNDGSYYTLDGNLPTEELSNTVFHVSTAPGDALIFKLKGLSRKDLAIGRIKSITKNANIEIAEAKETYFDGLESWEIVGHEKENGEVKRLIYEAMMFSDYVRYVIIATTEDNFEENLARFRQLSGTFELQ